MALQRVELKIGGMSCEHCVKAVREALEGVPGVTGVAVDLAGGRATLDLDPAQATVRDLVDAVEDQGFEAQAE